MLETSVYVHIDVYIYNQKQEILIIYYSINTFLHYYIISQNLINVNTFIHLRMKSLRLLSLSFSHTTETFYYQRKWKRKIKNHCIDISPE
jgi:hypothetical protein